MSMQQVSSSRPFPCPCPARQLNMFSTISSRASISAVGLLGMKLSSLGCTLKRSLRFLLALRSTSFVFSPLASRFFRYRSVSLMRKSFSSFTSLTQIFSSSLKSSKSSQICGLLLFRTSSSGSPRILKLPRFCWHLPLALGHCSTIFLACPTGVCISNEEQCEEDTFSSAVFCDHFTSYFSVSLVSCCWLCVNLLYMPSTSRALLSQDLPAAVSCWSCSSKEGMGWWSSNTLLAQWSQRSMRLFRLSKRCLYSCLCLLLRSSFLGKLPTGNRFNVSSSCCLLYLRSMMSLKRSSCPLRHTDSSMASSEVFCCLRMVSNCSSSSSILRTSSVSSLDLLILSFFNSCSADARQFLSSSSSDCSSDYSCSCGSLVPPQRSLLKKQAFFLRLACGLDFNSELQCSSSCSSISRMSRFSSSWSKRSVFLSGLLGRGCLRCLSDFGFMMQLQSDVDGDAPLLEEGGLGLGVAVQLVDVVLLQGDRLQEAVELGEAQDGVQGDLLELVVAEQQGVHLARQHVVEDLVELLVLQPRADELDHLDGLPVELVQEGLQVDPLEVSVEQLDGVAAHVGVEVGLLRPHRLQPLQVLVVLLLAVDGRPLPHLHLPLAPPRLELMLPQEVDLLLLLGQQQFLLDGVAVRGVDQLVALAALQTADQVFELIAQPLLPLYLALEDALALLEVPDGRLSVPPPEGGLVGLLPPVAVALLLHPGVGGNAVLEFEAAELLAELGADGLPDGGLHCFDAVDVDILLVALEEAVVQGLVGVAFEDGLHGGLEGLALLPLDEVVDAELALQADRRLGNHYLRHFLQVQLHELPHLFLHHLALLLDLSRVD